MAKRFFPAFVLILALAAVPASAADGPAAPELPNPLRNIAAGQWARYRLNTLFGAAEQRQTVLGVEGEGDGRVITIRTEMSLDGEIVDEREEASTYRKLVDEQLSALDGVENPSSASCETEAAGASFSAVAISYARDGQKYTLFLSEDIPLSGVIRLIEEGTEEPVVELIDFSD